MRNYPDEARLVAELAEHAGQEYGINLKADHYQRLKGGERNDVFLLGSKPNVIMRIIHHNTSIHGVEFVNRWSRYCAQYSPLVNAPFLTLSGKSYFSREDMLVSLFPFVPGTHANRNIPQIRQKMAEFQAQLHQISLACPYQESRKDRTSTIYIDLDHNFLYNWQEVETMLSQGGRALFEDPRYQDDVSQKTISLLYQKRGILYDAKEELTQLFKHLQGQKILMKGPIHGDMYGANVLAQKGHITGVIDWDEANVDLHVYELGRTMWEFCKDEKACTLRKNWALNYLENYSKAGGTSPKEEWHLLVPLIRTVKFLDIVFYMQNAIIGDVWSPAYGLESIHVLKNLKDFTLF